MGTWSAPAFLALSLRPSTVWPAVLFLLTDSAPAWCSGDACPAVRKLFSHISSRHYLCVRQCALPKQQVLLPGVRGAGTVHRSRSDTHTCEGSLHSLCRVRGERPCCINTPVYTTNVSACAPRLLFAAPCGPAFASLCLHVSFVLLSGWNVAKPQVPPPLDVPP